MIRRSTAVLTIALALGAVPSQGAPPKKSTPTKEQLQPAFVMTTDVARKLGSGDETEVQSALDDIRMSGKGAAAAAPAVAELLLRGTSAKLAVAALETLGDIESESTSPTITWYASHRNVTIRRAAVKALLKTRGPLAAKVLRRALGDPDPLVRGVAATGLGALKAKEAVTDLFLALDHKVPEAAVSIGQLCSPRECDKLLGYLRNLPFDVVTSGIGELLFRPATEVSDDAKVTVLGRIRELGTTEANRFLTDVQLRWPKTGSARVRNAIEQAVQATTGVNK